MKKEIADRWIAALRSGKYEQGYKRLNRDNKFCCLGVLCDILKDEIDLTVSVERGITHYNSNGSVLPNALLNYANLNSYMGYISSFSGDENTYCPEGLTLSHLNDSENYNFSKIADVIEKHWEEL
jgi:hypothetical protein